MVSTFTILVVNPGSTSTKLAVSGDGRLVDARTIHHAPGDLSRFGCVWGQFPFRLDLCMRWVERRAERYDAVVGTGGLLRPLGGGTYLVSKKMIRDAESNLQGEHASNLGCALAERLARDFHGLPLVVDPVSVDEFDRLAYYSGHPLIERRSLSHAVSIHAAAREAAADMGIPFAESSFVVCHMGGGTSVAAVRGGRIVDVNDAASDGPFSPERTGGLPLQPLLDLCFSGEYTRDRLKSMVMGKGGLVAYLGTNSTQEVERLIQQGDRKAREVYEAMAYQVAKEIGAMSVVLKGRVDGIVMTGGAAGSRMLTQWIEERVRHIASVILFRGDLEMEALALGALRVLRGEEEAKEY